MDSVLDDISRRSLIPSTRPIARPCALWSSNPSGRYHHRPFELGLRQEVVFQLFLHASEFGQTHCIDPSTWYRCAANEEAGEELFSRRG